MGSKHRLCTSITCMQCDTPQIRSRILHELTGEKLLTNGNTLSTGSSLKPSTNLSEEKSTPSSDSDFEDKSAVIRIRKKVSNSSKSEGDDNSSDTHDYSAHPTNISKEFTNFSSPKPLNWEQLPAC